MKITKPIEDILNQMQDFFLADNQRGFRSEDPFRSELFSKAQMEEYGPRVAASHILAKDRRPDKVLKRLDDNEAVIYKVHDILVESINQKQPLAPASEWFLDNFYLIKEQIALGRKHLPKGYSQTLPILAKGKSAGLPRVYDIALEIISHNDGRVDLANTTTFIRAYQSRTVLTLGELWAIPIMLRLGIIENIRRIASGIAIDTMQKNVAAYWTNQILETAQKSPRDIIIVLAEMAKSDLELSASFVAEFTRRLQGKGQALAMPLTLMDQRLAETGNTAEELITFENQRQAADQVSIRNSIESIRLIRTTDWRKFVESVSIVEKILKDDKDAIYENMDFNTRDRYRHVIEFISKKSSTPEQEVAKHAINLARESAARNMPARQQHVGYFLIDPVGRKALDEKAGLVRKSADKWKSFLQNNRFLSYSGTILLVSLLAGGLTAWATYTAGAGLTWAIIVFLLVFTGISQLTTVVINWIATHSIKPKPLPKMDFTEGIPDVCRTLVAVPCMLTSTKGIEELVEELEVRYLANPETNIYFSLLTDFGDAPNEKMPDDDRLLAYAKQLIEDLNNKYIYAQSQKFYLFHRPRKWNPAENTWMAYERKRGKLGELNSLLRDTGYDDFSLIVGNIQEIKDCRYVITLDADTHLPREAARKLIAAMYHPLNRPVLNEKSNRVVEGFGILQPRVAVNLPLSDSSIYTRMHSSDSGLDPYTQLVSDVYQDLFSEGSFIGKGIYDIDAFEKVLGDAFPENRILSHDLLEGTYVRAGLLTDVQLFEDYPATYWSDIARRHRWVRGDWQIASWGTPYVPDRKNKLRRNILSGLSRWKIMDNLRRSLVPATLVLLLIISWLVLPKPLLWTLGILMVFFFMPIFNAVWQFFRKPTDIDLVSHLSSIISEFKQSVTHLAFNLACLPFEAWVNMDAVLRSSWRMTISGRHLLEWTPSAVVNRKKDKNLLETYDYMWFAPFLVLLVTLLILYISPNTIFIASPILLLWLFAPAWAWYISKPGIQKLEELSSAKRDFLHVTARKTWGFFEDFVTQSDNWLPPDNYQERPVERIAHRTSPTNIGLAVLSALSAYDFGYLTPNQLIRNLQKTFATLNSLERFRGHFYNWYDTETLVPLNPRYISTVDSGNFIASLLTLRQGLVELPDVRIISDRRYEGLTDTLLVIKSNLDPKLHNHLENIERLLSGLTAQPPEFIPEAKGALEILLSELLSLQNIPALAEDQGCLNWIAKMEKQIRSGMEDLIVLTPWSARLPVPPKFEKLKALNNISTIREIYHLKLSLVPEFKRYLAICDSHEETKWLEDVLADLKLGGRNALELLSIIEQLTNECNGFSDVEYDFLYDKPKHLFYIGFNASDDVSDKSYYDMLASEARLGIFTAIAQGKVPQESWFALGRLVTNPANAPVLLSWSGSMFEYLMPQLMMPVYTDTLLERTGKAALKNQIEYAAKNNVPWGISESAFNLVDTSLNYQYQSFGVPGLGLKRGLGDDLVIAPYATMLAVMVDPSEACDNLLTLSKSGFSGKYGFYEAIDYTPSRMPRGESHVLIKSFMSHHQGMGFLALAYYLLDEKMQRRFEREPVFQSALLLLQERAPKATNFYAHTEDPSGDRLTTNQESFMRVISTPNTTMPEVQLLSNGKYQLVVSNAGGGYSRWKNITLTRWREDSTQDNWGLFCYIKDLSSGNYWSNTYQPTLQRSKSYQSIFSQGHAEFRRVDEGFETKTEIVVSPEDDVEIRRIRVTNRSNSSKTIEVTSYSEVVLTEQAADEAHPAFSNLFVQTSIQSELSAITCTRRSRSKDDTPPWMFHMMTLNGAQREQISFETDRMKFTGRTRSLSNPAAMQTDGPLSGSQGPVLDPIVAIRYRITLRPKQTATFDLVTGAAEHPEACEALIVKYQDRHLKNRAFELSWTHSQVLLRQINVTESDAQLFNGMAGSILFANPAHRADPTIIASNFKNQSGLWSYSISGDLPIVLLRVHDSDNIELAKYLIKAHAYWRLKGLVVDLVIWNEDYGSYRQELHDQIVGFVSASGGSVIDQPGGVFVRSGDQISNEDRILFETVARLIFDDNEGSLTEQLAVQKPARPLPALLKTSSGRFAVDTSKSVQLPDHLIFENGTGGFTADGREYIMLTSQEKPSPAPWVNIIANDSFGTMISESGSSYSWADNANAFRLTPWRNDPVSDGTGEAFYIRDEDSGRFWSLSPLPAPSGQPYLTRHGFGYTVFEHLYDGIRTEMWVYVDVESPLKFIVLKIRNVSGRDRSLSATGYMEWVLGESAPKTAMHVVTEKDPETGILLVRNRYDAVFGEKICFFDVSNPEKSFTCDRAEFLGRNGSTRNPAALLREKLSGRIGAALDPCTAIQVRIELSENEEKEVVFRVGAGKNEHEARELAKRFRQEETAHQAQSKIHDQWNQILGAVNIKTPDEAFNIMTNGWWVYQTLACRLWGRSGFYQSGGAFGFRDQLQDVLALMHTRPDLTKKQILLAASRQFKEGDVQHWWHPPSGRGVRTTCSDDYLWLPFVTARYIQTTGDIKILDEYVSFIEGRELRPDEESYYDLPVFLNHWETLYNHCKAAIKYGLKFGEHGLPLIGSGDWNDGMDKVGAQGKGESVWLGFFLYDVLVKFGAIASSYGDREFEEICKNESEKLEEHINEHGWDGEWYRRAYFDDGTPLGSNSNEECRIDSISQSWSVLSGAGRPERTPQAMESLGKYLVDAKSGIIKLLDPPFDKSDLNPGYIKGYVPGVRENGGQYTHAAVWAIMAFAVSGNRQKVWELFSMINPVNHAKNAAEKEHYKAEPYVMAADVYGADPYKGRGGWTWYTGSAGWTYQLALEHILGLKRQGQELHLEPCIPDSWPGFEITYRFGNSYYHLQVVNLRKDGHVRLTLDGNALNDSFLTLVDDQLRHEVKAEI
jgi:cellobiose phosphorylase